jgi:hypothetical protein
MAGKTYSARTPEDLKALYEEHGDVHDAIGTKAGVADPFLISPPSSENCRASHAVTEGNSDLNCAIRMCRQACPSSDNHAGDGRSPGMQIHARQNAVEASC